jgi:hypothetical protein
VCLVPVIKDLVQTIANEMCATLLLLNNAYLAGKAISADYTYMIGCNNDLAVRHIPEIAVRNDTLAGPLHRRCDMVRTKHRDFNE